MQGFNGLILACLIEHTAGYGLDKNDRNALLRVYSIVKPKAG